MYKSHLVLTAIIFCLYGVETNGFSTQLKMKQKSTSSMKMNGNNLNRRSFMTDLGAGATTFGGITLLSPSAFAANLPSTETKAPDFELPNSRGDGKTSLKDLTKDGKWTVLYFYPGA